MEPNVEHKAVAVKRSTAARMLDCGATKIWQLQKSGELVTIKLGADSRITVDSINEYAKRHVAQVSSS